MKYSALLIENDPAVLKVFQKTIPSCLPDFALNVAQTPDEALCKLKMQPYDIVVCDLFLARDEKINFTSNLCSQRLGTPLLVVTSDSDITMNNLPELVQASCAKGVLHKPFLLADLLKMIRQIVAAPRVLVGIVARHGASLWGRPRVHAFSSYGETDIAWTSPPAPCTSCLQSPRLAAGA
jgi:CheY-like chemotaxis protein